MVISGKRQVLVEEKKKAASDVRELEGYRCSGVCSGEELIEAVSTVVMERSRE